MFKVQGAWLVFLRVQLKNFDLRDFSTSFIISSQLEKEDRKHKNSRKKPCSFFATAPLMPLRQVFPFVLIIKKTL